MVVEEVDDGEAPAGERREVRSVEVEVVSERRPRSRRPRRKHRPKEVRQGQVPAVVEPRTPVAKTDVAKQVRAWWKKRGAAAVQDPTPLAACLIDVGKLALGILADDMTNPNVSRKVKREIALAVGPRLGVEFRKRVVQRPKTSAETDPGDDDGATTEVRRIYGV